MSHASASASRAVAESYVKEPAEQERQRRLEVLKTARDSWSSRRNAGEINDIGDVTLSGVQKQRQPPKTGAGCDSVPLSAASTNSVTCVCVYAQRKEGALCLRQPDSSLHTLRHQHLRHHRCRRPDATEVSDGGNFGECDKWEAGFKAPHTKGRIVLFTTISV